MKVPRESSSSSAASSSSVSSSVQEEKVEESTASYRSSRTSRRNGASSLSYSSLSSFWTPPSALYAIGSDNSIIASISSTDEQDDFAPPRDNNNNHNKKTFSWRSIFQNTNASRNTTTMSLHKEDCETAVSRNSISLGTRSTILTNQQHKKWIFLMAFIAHFVFFIGSTLQVLVAQGDLRWTKSVQEYPTYILQADDDATWQVYQQQQKYQRKHSNKHELYNYNDQNNNNNNSNDDDENDRMMRRSLGYSLYYKDIKEERDWNDLSTDAKVALQVLGHDQSNWDGNIVAPSVSSSQSLSKEKQNFGHNNEDHVPEEEVADEYEADVQEQQKKLQRRWSGLSREEKMAAKVLGYNREKWNQDIDDTYTSIEYNKKDDNTDAEMSFENDTIQNEEAEEELLSLDGNDHSVFNISQWREIDWEDLPKEKRVALEILGYDHELWKSGGTPYTKDLNFDDLTPIQQNEAAVLGYTKKTWKSMFKSTDNDEYDGKLEDFTTPTATTDIHSEPIPTASLTNAPVSQTLVAAPISTPTISVSETRTPSPAPTSASTFTPTKASVKTKTPTAKKETKEGPSTSATAPVELSSNPEPTSTPSRTTINGQEESKVDSSDKTVFPPKNEYFEDEVILSVGPVEFTLVYILSILSSICFLFVGVLNWIREEQVFHIWMIQGSISMIISILCISFSQTGSLIFKSLAFHCYFLEGAYMLRLRKSIHPLDGLETLSCTLWAADCMFGAGALVNIIMSYWQFLDVDAEFDLNLGYCKVLSAWLWLFASLIYSTSTIILSRKTIDQYIVGSQQQQHHHGQFEDTI